MNFFYLNWAQTCKHTNIQTCKHANIQTYKHPNMQTCTHTPTQTKIKQKLTRMCIQIYPLSIFPKTLVDFCLRKFFKSFKAKNQHLKDYPYKYVC